MNLKTILIIILVLVAISLVVGWFQNRSNEYFVNSYQANQQVNDTNKSLYDRLGGIFPIAAVVNNFSDALITNSVVGQNSANPQLRDWSINHLDRLPGLKWMRTLWLASLAGGPFNFEGTVPEKCPFSLENAHNKFKISPAEFDAVAQELAKSLDYYKVPEKEKNEVLQAFAAHKGEINQGYYQSMGQQSPQVVCPEQFYGDFMY